MANSLLTCSPILYQYSVRKRICRISTASYWICLVYQTYAIDAMLHSMNCIIGIILISWWQYVAISSKCERMICRYHCYRNSNIRIMSQITNNILKYIQRFDKSKWLLLPEHVSGYISWTHERNIHRYRIRYIWCDCTVNTIVVLHTIKIV